MTDIGEEVLGYYHDAIKVSGGVLHQKNKLSAAFKAFYCGDPEDTAWVVLYQGEKCWQTAIQSYMEKNPHNLHIKSAIVTTRKYGTFRFKLTWF